jgi:hypothetical protein
VEANTGDGTDIGAFEAQTAPVSTNTAPSVEAGGPYSVAEGGSVAVSAIGADPEGDELTYEWDLDDDGEFETAGQEVTFSAATLDGPDIRTIRVRVTDTGNLSEVAETSVEVLDVAPAVDPLQISPFPSFPGGAVSVSAVFSDPGPNDGPFTCTFNFGDGPGEVPGTVSGNTCSAAPHLYSAVGSYPVTVTVRDKNGVTGTNSSDALVVYNFSGFFSPVANRPNVNQVKAGSRVSITFSLGGNQGLNIFEPNSPTSRLMDCSTKETSGVPVTTKPPPPTGLTYNKKTNRYTYAWQTEKAWAGTCREFVLTLKDGTAHAAWFTFKK